MLVGQTYMNIASSPPSLMFPSQLSRFDERVSEKSPPMHGSLVLQQDMVQALILAEGVYKAADLGEAAAVDIMDSMQSELPEHLCRLEAVQWSQPHGPQR